MERYGNRSLAVVVSSLQMTRRARSNASMLVSLYGLALRNETSNVAKHVGNLSIASSHALVRASSCS